MGNRGTGDVALSRSCASLSSSALSLSERVCRRSENGCVTEALDLRDALSSLSSSEAVDSNQGRLAVI
jgi:hypothetical protein